MDNFSSANCERKNGRTRYNQNIIPNLFRNSWWVNGLMDWDINVGQISVEEDSSGFNNLIIDSEKSTQIKQRITLKPGHIYFLMFDVKVEYYVRGLFGVYFNGKFENCSSDIGLRRRSKNGDYETIIARIETTDDWVQPRTFFVGSIGSANGSGQLRKLSLYDLTEIFGSGNEPSESFFYENLSTLQDDKGIYLNVFEVFKSNFSKKYLNENMIVHQTKIDVIKIFIDEMNKKAEALGMMHTKFRNVNGFRATGQVTTVKDFLKLGVYATGNNELLKVWGKDKHKVSIYGDFPREVFIESTVKIPGLEKSEMLLGGKTGTIGSDVQNIFSVVSDAFEEIYLAVVFGASGSQANQNRNQALKDLLKIARLNKKNQSIEQYEIQNVMSGGIIKLPSGNPFFYTNQNIELIYGVNENSEVEPASLVKIMNAVLLLENISNLNQLVTIVPSDITGGSGPKIQAGDSISLLDLLYLLMLPSSNTAAKAIARVVGQELMSQK